MQEETLVIGSENSSATSENMSIYFFKFSSAMSNMEFWNTCRRSIYIFIYVPFNKYNVFSASFGLYFPNRRCISLHTYLLVWLVCNCLILKILLKTQNNYSIQLFIYYFIVIVQCQNDFLIPHLLVWHYSDLYIKTMGRSKSCKTM